MALRKHLSNRLMYCHDAISKSQWMLMGAGTGSPTFSSTLEYSSQQVLIAGPPVFLCITVYTAVTALYATSSLIIYSCRNPAGATEKLPSMYQLVHSLALHKHAGEQNAINTLMIVC